MLKTNMRSIASLILAAAFALSACSNGNGGVDDAGSQQPNETQPSNAAEASNGTQASSEPVTVTVFAPQTEGIQKLDENRFSKHLEERLNIKFDWEITPYNVFGDKKMLLLASGDYPSVILDAGMSKADLIKYGKQGVLLPLNDLIDRYAPNIKQAMEEIDYLKPAMTAPDGIIYALPKVNECKHCTFGHRMWINTAWLEKLGLAMPTTTDEFYEVLKAFKEQDPNGNGQPDEIPLTTSYDMWGGGLTPFLMNAFIYEDPATRLSIRDGEVIMSAAQPEWKEGLAYLRKLYSEGLVDQGAFTQNNDAVRQLGAKPEPVVGAVSYALISSMIGVNDETPLHKDYDVVPPLKGPAGVQLSYYDVGAGGGQFVITNKATEEQQIAAIRLADYLFSEEGTLMTTWGFEEGGWIKAKEGSLDYNGNQAKYEDITKNRPQGTLDETWWQLGTMKMTNAMRESFVAPEDPLGNGGYEYRLWLAAKKYEPYAKPEVVYPKDVFYDPDDATFIAQIQKSIQDYVNTNAAQFITGNRDLEKDWESYLEGFQGMKLDQYLEVMQSAIAE